jgi:hypothetical protein
LEWDRWSRGELLWHLFEKYQPIFAMRFPSLRLGAAVRAVFTGVSICGMCFINALLFEYSPVGPGIPRDPRCEDAGELSTYLALVNGIVTTLCKVGVVTLIVGMVSKDVCYQYEDEQQLAQVRKWVNKERFGIFMGVLYVIATSWYVAIFLFMLPYYAAQSYLQATVASLLMIMFLKPLLQAGILAVILKSKYGLSFAAHFPQLSDFSHLHVMEDAEFTHAHWAELSRVLNSSVESDELDPKIGVVEPKPESGNDRKEAAAAEANIQVSEHVIKLDVNDAGLTSVATNAREEAVGSTHTAKLEDTVVGGGAGQKTMFGCGAGIMPCAACDVETEPDSKDAIREIS